MEILRIFLSISLMSCAIFRIITRQSTSQKLQSIRRFFKYIEVILLILIVFCFCFNTYNNSRICTTCCSTSINGYYCKECGSKTTTRKALSQSVQINTGNDKLYAWSIKGATIDQVK